MKKVHQDAVMRTHSMYAAIQATLHNAHFKHPRGDGEKFLMQDFMPGGRPPQSAEEKAAIFSAMMNAAKEAFRTRKRAASPPQEAIPAAIRERAARRSRNSKTREVKSNGSG